MVLAKLGSVFVAHAESSVTLQGNRVRQAGECLNQYYKAYPAHISHSYNISHPYIIRTFQGHTVFYAEAKLGARAVDSRR